MLEENNLGGMLSGDTMIVAAVLVLLVLGFVIWKFFGSSGIPENRLKAVLDRRESLRAELKAENAAPREVFQEGWLKDFAMQVRRSSFLQPASLKKKLLRAGIRGKDAPIIFIAFKLVLPIVLFVVGMVLVGVLGVGGGKPMIKLALTLFVPIGAFMLPDLWLKNAIQKREDIMRKSLPDALDLLVICAEAGLGLDAALDRVGGEITQSQPVLAEEIGITAVELGFLPDRRTALNGFAERVQLPSVRALINTLVQTEKYGTPLAQALRVLSAELREERMMRAEEKAAKLPATLTVPMIMFILPTLFIVLIGPAIIQVFDLNK
jgi:tight adherence protein C